MASLMKILYFLAALATAMPVNGINGNLGRMKLSAAAKEFTTFDHVAASKPADKLQ